MALVNPNIAMSFRQPEIQMPNALAQYAQLQQIQGGQQAQELARFQLGAAQRAESVQNALTDAYASSIDPMGNIDYNKLIGSLAKGGGASQIPGVLKTKAETKAAQLAQTKTEGEIAKNQFDLQDKKLKFAWNAVGSSPTPEAAIAELTKGVKNGIFDMRSATDEIQRVRSLTPDEYRQYRVEKILGILDAKDKLGFMLPKTRDRDTGSVIQVIQDNPALPGYGQPIAGAAVTKTPTISESTAQGQLNLAQQKFDFEKANPTMSIQEDPSGLLAVNTRTGVATPVVYGPNGIQVAPAAAPSAGMPGPRLPAQTIQAIPGMTSVLDRTAAPLVAQGGERMPGMPVPGKEKALTETQSNATAFGMRMKEANSILTSLEKAGVKNTGLIRGVAGSIVGVVPLIGDKLEGMTGSVFNLLPQIMGGLSPEQQQTAQARLNFITANLRKESGATLLPSEFITEERKYFPKPGDDETVIAQKQKARNLAIKAMEIQAGPGAKNIQQYQTGVAGSGGDGGGGIPGATATNPLGLNIPGVR